MARTRRKGCGVWLLFWIIIFMALLLLFMMKRGDFKDRGISKYLKSHTPAFLKSTKKRVAKKNVLTNLKVKLYFVKYIERLDKLKLVYVERTIPKTDAPLMDTMKLLLKGPTQAEEAKGISSVFPAGVKIRDIRVKNGIAYIDFNSVIEMGVGIPMLQARLYQIVYTATQFPTVKKVRLLINGKKKDTFSVEGLSIKYPLGRLETEPIF